MNIPAEIIIASGSAVAGIITITLGFFIWQFRKVISDVGDVKLRTAVIQQQIMDALRVRDQVAVDHDKLIRLEKTVEEAQKDISFYHEKIRETNARIDGLIDSEVT